MELTIIIGLFIIGFTLVFIELFFIPGTTVAGVLGVIALGIGIYQIYHTFDTATANWILTVVLLSFIILLIIAAKTKTWDRFSNKKVLTERVRPGMSDVEIVAGDRGKAISAIRPIGKARINGEDYEVRSTGEFIPASSKIEVLKVTPSKVIVKIVEEDNKS